MGEGIEIPIDVVLQIFLRLPVKSVFRFMSVSKAWRDMISLDPDFIQKHYLLAQQNPDRQHKIRIESSRVMVDGTPITSTFLNDTVSNSNLEILPSCKGILLVGFGLQSLHLWNPFTGSHKKLGVPCDLNDGRYGIRMYGLVFDSSCKAFVVIRIRSVNYKTTVGIYNSRTGFWKRKDEFPYEVFRDHKGVFWNGYTHWVVARPLETGMEDSDMRYRARVVIYYDPADDKFKELGFPDFLYHWFCFAIFNGYLCLYVTGRSKYAWVLKETGGPWIQITPEEWAQVRQLNLNDHYDNEFGITRCCVETLLSPHIDVPHE